MPGLTARTMAACMPGAASWVKLTSAWTNPTAARPSRYSRRDRAPAIAADVAAASGSVGRCQVVFGDHVGDADTPTRREHSVHLGQHGGLIDGQINHTIRDDHIDRAVGQWMSSPAAAR